MLPWSDWVSPLPCGTDAMGTKMKISITSPPVRQPARCCPRTRHVWGTRQSRWLPTADGFAVWRPAYIRPRRDGAFAEAVFGSVELIVHPDAHDVVGEMCVCVWSARFSSRDLVDSRGWRLRGIFSARSLPRVFAIGLAGRIIGADSSNNLLPRVVQCVAEWGISRVG